MLTQTQALMSVARWLRKGSITCGFRWYSDEGEYWATTDLARVAGVTFRIENDGYDFEERKDGEPVESDEEANEALSEMTGISREHIDALVDISILHADDWATGTRLSAIYVLEHIVPTLPK